MTHHVEEIPAGFTHVLLLREGRVVAAGPIREVLTGRMLTETFGTRLRSGRVRDRYWARSVPSDMVSRWPPRSRGRGVRRVRTGRIGRHGLGLARGRMDRLVAHRGGAGWG